ncbi:MAG: TetR/AcrR family transcriptional regulator [Pseudomonadota bacterium]
MGRPSVKSERRQQILDAYEACVARYGVEGASLEVIAETAGLARPLIRYNVGNRNDLLEALVERFLSRFDDAVNRTIAALPASGAADKFIDWLFDPTYSDTRSVLVAEALIAASQNDPALAERMRAWTRRFSAAIKEVLEVDHAANDPDVLDAVSTGIAGIYFNSECLTPLGPMKDVRQASKRAAKLLLGVLG